MEMTTRREHQQGHQKWTRMPRKNTDQAARPKPYTQDSSAAVTRQLNPEEEDGATPKPGGNRSEAEGEVVVVVVVVATRTRRTNGALNVPRLFCLSHRAPGTPLGRPLHALLSLAPPPIRSSFTARLAAFTLC
ncbi:hypothetical protein O3P69_015451 [Scylla paramamosain]|uniref:Uncharacterized protein n=1 Tax=Scylla paramamosain TaxID=85552 RepID=A0AAW0T4Z5_SCYPA